MEYKENKEKEHALKISEITARLTTSVALLDEFTKFVLNLLLSKRLFLIAIQGILCGVLEHLPT